MRTGSGEYQRIGGEVSPGRFSAADRAMTPARGTPSFCATSDASWNRITGSGTLQEQVLIVTAIINDLQASGAGLIRDSRCADGHHFVVDSSRWAAKAHLLYRDSALSFDTATFEDSSIED